MRRSRASHVPLFRYVDLLLGVLCYVCLFVYVIFIGWFLFILFQGQPGALPAYSLTACSRSARKECFFSTDTGRQNKCVTAGSHPQRTANLRTEILDFRESGSSRILILRGGIPRPIGNFPESLRQAILAEIITYD